MCLDMHSVSIYYNRSLVYEVITIAKKMCEGRDAEQMLTPTPPCLLITSDAADE